MGGGAVKVLNRICLYERTLEDGDKSLTLRRGQEYVTSASPNQDGEVIVFSTYWTKVPVEWFAGPQRLDGTPEETP